MGNRLGLIGAALAAAAILPVAADAQYWGPPARYIPVDRRGYPGGYDDRRAPPPGYGRGDDGRDYEGDVPPGYRGDYPRGYRGRPPTRCDRGTGGTILGAIAGGLLGNAAAGRGDRGIGTVVGAGVGALAGRAIDRDC